MGLFLPVLLLGLAQPVDQPTTSAPVQVQGESRLATKELPSSPSPLQSLPTRKLRSGQDGRRVCYTMRSYIFERRDDLAPELLGMTTCTPAQATSEKEVHGKARLVPAN